MTEFVIAFDLDDTLYLERDFVRSGFRVAGDWMEKSRNLAGLETQCEALFAAGRRTDVFNGALAALGHPVGTDTIRELVEVYRRHIPSISLADDARRYLAKKPSNVRFALISDGWAETQLGKIRALGLEGVLDRVICTDTWGREFWKPHHRAFADVEEWSRLPTDRLVYVADNCTKDFVAPRARGWWTVQIARPEGVHPRPEVEEPYRARAIISSLDELDNCLSGLVPGYGDSVG